MAVFRRGQYPHLDSFLKQVRDVGQIQAMMSQLLGADDGEILHALQGVPPERLEEVIDEIESRAGRSRLQAAVSGSESYLPAQQQFSRPEVRSVQSEQWEDAMAHYLAQKSLDSFEYEFLARLGSEQIRPFSDFLARYLAVRSPQFQTGSVWPSGSIEPNAVKARYRKFLKENSRSDEVAYFDQHVELLMRNAQFAQRIEAASVPDGFDVSFRNALENEDFKGAVLSATREVFHDYYKALPDGGLGYAEEMRRLEELARAGLEADLYRQGFQLILHTYFDEMTVEKLLELAQPQRRIEQIALVVKLQNVFGLDERKMKVAVELGDAGKRLQVLTALKEVAPTKIGGRFVRLIDHLITLAEQENRAEVRAAVTAAELDTMRKVFNRTKTREIQSENGWYHFKKGGVDYEFRQTRDGGLEIGIRPPSQEFKTLVMDALGNVRYPSEFKGIDAQLKEFFEAFVGLMLVKDLDRAEVRSHLGRKDPIGLCVTSDTLLPIVRKVKGGRPKVEGRGREKVEEKQIVNVKAGDYVLSLNEETEKIEPRRINTLLDMGIKPVYRLTTASGRSIKTTANHPYLVKAEGGRRKAEGKSASRWIKVSELKVGDQIAVPKDQELSAINVTPVADFRDQDTVSFPVKDRAVDTDLETIRRNGAPLDALRKDKRIGLGEIVLDFHKNSLLDIWRKFQEHALGMAGEIIGDHFMPRFFLTSFPEIRPERRDASREAKNSGLDASMSSWISSITSLSKTSPSVLPFPSTRRTIPLNKKANFETWSGFKRTIFSSVRPLSNGAVIFSPPNRQKYITDRAGLRKVGLSGFFSVPEAYAAAPGRPSQTPSDILWDLIVAIEPAGVDRVWDIEVEGTHNFVGNGIFAHNTSAMKSILGIPRGVLSDVPSAPALEPSSRAEVRAQKDDVPSTKFSFGRLIQASFISFAGSIFFSLTGWIGVSASFFAFALFAELAGGPSLTRALGRRIGAMFNQRKELKVEAVQSIAATPDRGKLLDANPYLPPGIGRPEVRVPEEVKLRTLLDIVEGVHRIFAQFDLNLSRLRSDTDAFWLTSLIVRQKSHLEGYEAVGMIPPVDRLQDRELRDFVERLRSLPAYEDAGNVVIGEGTLKALNSLVLIDTYAILGRHGRAEVRKETVEVARILGGLDLQTLMDAAEPGWNTVNQIAERLETAHRAELSVSDLLDAKESELRAEFRSVRESVDLELLVNQVAELEEPAAPGRIQTVLEHALPFGFAVARPEIRALVVATAENLYRIYETQEHAFVQASEQISGTELIAVEEAGRMAVEGLVVAIRRGEVQELNNFIFYDRSFKDELHSYVLQVSRAFGAEARDRFHLHFIASNPQAIDEFLGEVNGLLQAEGLPALPTGAAQHIFGIRNLEDVRNAPNIARAIQMRLESGKPFAIYFIPAAVAEALPGHSLVTHSVRLDERDPLALKHSFALVPLLDSYFNGTLEPSQASLAQFLRQSNFASRGIAFSNGVIVSVSQFLSALIAEGEKARETRAIAA
ncbi:MAG: hypothetical protein A3G87_06255 [Omnitrophica bacterium RIFCSPLOWO2_12_FULL_50_11]|nr:MAG: hypothetical protein A3G87_06255 [Omnitrophica bacterium RIFCSPLOWO2_12_FULL_50_11]